MCIRDSNTTKPSVIDKEVLMGKKYPPPIEWKEQLAAILKVPWLVPICSSHTDGLAIDVSREIQLTRCATFLHVGEGKEKDLSLVDSTNNVKGISWMYGKPLKSSRLIGIAFSAYSLAVDEEIQDFVRSDTRRAVYSSACSAILEMGATHVRNVPFAGFIHSSGLHLCLKGMGKVTSEWRVLIRGGLYRSSPIQRWLRVSVHTDSMSYPEHVKPRVLALWFDEKQAIPLIESIYFQIAGLSTWNYFLSQLSLAVEKIESPVVPVVPDTLIAKLVRFLIEKNPMAIASREGKRLHPHQPTLYRQLYPYIGIVSSMIRSAIKPSNRIATIGDAVEKLLTDSSFRKEVVKRISSLKDTKAYNPRRMRWLLNLIERARNADSIKRRRKLFSRLKRELVLKEHTYYDKDYKTRITCEHVIHELHLLSTGYSAEETKDEVIRKYAIDPTLSIAASSGIELLTPTLVVCKYCGARIESIWMIDGGEEYDETPIQVEKVYLEDEVGMMLNKMLGVKAIITSLSPVDLTNVINSLIRGPLASQQKKLGKISADKKIAKQKYLLIAAVISLLNELSIYKADITIDKDVMETHIMKEYVHIFEAVGIIEGIVDKVIGYWPDTLAAYYPKSSRLIQNAVAELQGAEENEVLRMEYNKRLLLPLHYYLPKDINWKEGILYSKLVPLVKDHELKNFVMLLLDYRPILTSPRFSVMPPPIKRALTDLPTYHTPSKKTKQQILYVREATKTQITRDQFIHAIMAICPQLLIKPLTRSSSSLTYYDEIRLGPHLFRMPKQEGGGGGDYDPEEEEEEEGDIIEGQMPIKDVEDADIAIITEEEPEATDDFEQAHLRAPTSKVKAKCAYCGLQGNYSFGSDYFERYKDIVEKKWLHAPPITYKAYKLRYLESIDVRSIKYRGKLSSTVEKDLLRKFEAKYEWRSKPSIALSEVLGYSLYSIGEPGLGRILLGKNVRNEHIITAWNYFLRWSITQKETVVKRMLHWFRSAFADANTIKAD